MRLPQGLRHRIVAVGGDLIGNSGEFLRCYDRGAAARRSRSEAARSPAARKPAPATRRKLTDRLPAQVAAAPSTVQPTKMPGKVRGRQQRRRAPATTLPTADCRARDAMRVPAEAESAAGLVAFRSTRPKAAPSLWLRRILLPANLTCTGPRNYAAIYALKANPACDRAQLIGQLQGAAARPPILRH
jgi:hypothetical protein